MFSMEEKQVIAGKIQELLLGFHHPEMPTENPNFHLHVEGKEGWSWADIKPNWTYSDENPPVNREWNEYSRETLTNLSKGESA